MRISMMVNFGTPAYQVLASALTEGRVCRGWPTSGCGAELRRPAVPRAQARSTAPTWVQAAIARIKGVVGQDIL